MNIELNSFNNAEEKIVAIKHNVVLCSPYTKHYTIKHYIYVLLCVFDLLESTTSNKTEFMMSKTTLHYIIDIKFDEILEFLIFCYFFVIYCIKFVVDKTIK